MIVQIGPPPDTLPGDAHNEPQQEYHTMRQSPSQALDHGTKHHDRKAQLTIRNLRSSIAGPKYNFSPREEGLMLPRSGAPPPAKAKNRISPLALVVFGFPILRECMRGGWYTRLELRAHPTTHVVLIPTPVAVYHKGEWGNVVLHTELDLYPY